MVPKHACTSATHSKVCNISTQKMYILLGHSTSKLPKLGRSENVTMTKWNVTTGGIWVIRKQPELRSREWMWSYRLGLTK